jgi:hypothetical protein
MPASSLDFRDELDGTAGGYGDTAAVLTCLDLVVACDTAAHLAGALGVPAWVAVSAVADWRWLRDRDDTPWYPRTRPFRQQVLGDWRGVFGRMAAELRGGTAGREAAADGGVFIAVSPGELLDRASILAIKAERFRDEGKQARAAAELATLAGAQTAVLARGGAEATRLAAKLRAVNERLWAVEDELRECEHDGAFGERFVELARSVYRSNDERAGLKRRLDALLGSALGEQKEYAREA